MRSYQGITLNDNWLRENPDLIYPPGHELMSIPELRDAILTKPKDYSSCPISESDLIELINKTRQAISRKHKLKICFADYCDITCELLADKLSKYTMEVYLINGDYKHQYPDSKPDVYGHCWLTIPDLNLLIDPTRCQFDSYDFIVNLNDPNAIENYIFP